MAHERTKRLAGFNLPFVEGAVMEIMANKLCILGESIGGSVLVFLFDVVCNCLIKTVLVRRGGSRIRITKIFISGNIGVAVESEILLHTDSLRSTVSEDGRG